MTASTRPGMGATLYGDGATFRLWAPFARAVSVAGGFSGWTTNPLASEGNGFWSADLDGASSGQEYKFLVTTAQGVTLWRNDPYALVVTSSVGNSVISDQSYAWQSTGYGAPSWNELVIYELHVGSFAFDVRSASGRGDFKTVVDRLDYLRDLGVNAIQLMPSDQFPGDVSWGYNPSDLFAIESNYGGPNALRRLVDAAHARGLAVLFDVVYNHLGPTDLDLWRFDGWSENGGGGVYFYNDWRAATPWGATRPDYGRGEVRQFVRDNVLHWLESCQFDGLRWDATGWIRNVYGTDDDPSSDLADGWSLMQWCNSEIGARMPWKLAIAEDMHDNEWITLEVAAGGAGFGSQWGASFLHTLRAAVTAPYDEARSMTAVATAIEQRFGGDAFARVIYTESHDEVAASAGQARVPELIAPGDAEGYYAQKRSTLAAALVFTAPGIPMIFMGQEHLEVGSWSEGSELDWSRSVRFAGIEMLYRDLARLRRNWFDRTRGLRGHEVSAFHVNDRDKLIAMHRWDRGGPGDDVVVLANFSSRGYDSYRIGLPRDGTWRVRFNSDWRGYSSVFGDHPSYDVGAIGSGRDDMQWSGDVGIGAYTAIILSQDD
jgi:1,4-alpha-glucan branching enzyme